MYNSMTLFTMTDRKKNIYLSKGYVTVQTKIEK